MAAPGASRPPITTLNLPASAREVELPVCPECGQIGKQPGSPTTSYYCTGPVGDGHPRASMQEIRFLADPPEPEEKAA